MNTIVEQYLIGLKKNLPEEDILALSYAFGATVDQLNKLKERFRACPNSLLELLGKINGTYWQQYGNHKISVLVLGSDVFEYPYFLKSVEQILEDNPYTKSIRDIYNKYWDSMPDLVGEGIDPDVNLSHWLYFSDCMNNGGTSSLFIDFNPTPQGKPGQIVRFLHDPDSFKVIANSFDEYLQMIIDNNYNFISVDEEW